MNKYKEYNTEVSILHLICTVLGIDTPSHNIVVYDADKVEIDL